MKILTVKELLAQLKQYEQDKREDILNLPVAVRVETFDDTYVGGLHEFTIDPGHTDVLMLVLEGSDKVTP